MESSSVTLCKRERLSRKRHIDTLFADGSSFIAFPLRIVYLPRDADQTTAKISVLIIAPKRKLKHAADRNLVKRRIRESYRLQKAILSDCKQAMHVAFLYLDDKPTGFTAISKAMTKALHTLRDKQ